MIVERAVEGKGVSAGGSTDPEPVAAVEVDPNDNSVAFGANCQTIEPVPTLVARHHHVDDINLTRVLQW